MTREGTTGYEDTLAVSLQRGAAAPPAADRAGELIGQRYRLVSLLGTGGMGAVYLARDRELDELVAVKLLRQELAASPEALALLRSEVKLARRVTHRNVVRIFELGDHAGERFLSMEFVDGEPLSALLQRHGPQPLERAVAMLRAACAGVQAAHDAGVVHRDIKPDNVLVASDGRIAVTDFGIARGVGTGAGATSVVGTPLYMAPEQLRGRDPCTRADVYALGVTAFEVLTGRRPWEPAPPTALAELKTQPLPPIRLAELPAPIAPVLARALDPEPSRRPPSPAALAEALGAASASPTVPPELRPSGCAPTALGGRKRAVAVLPFENRGDAGDAAVVEGFTEDLVDTLCSIAELRVLSYAASRRVNAEPDDAARQLGVDVVVSGSVARVAAEVVVRARAITADGAQLWAERLTLPPERLLHATRGIAAALGRVLEVDTRDRDVDTLPGESLDLYLRARASYRILDRADEATELFRRALALAPDNPLVNVAYANALIRLWMVIERDPGDLVETATACADRALRAAPHLGEPHLARGYLHLHHGDPAGAMRELRAAVARAPSLSDAHAMMGSLLIECGRVTEGVRRSEVAVELDPTQFVPTVDRLRCAALLGDWPRADELAGALPEPTTATAWLIHLRVAAYRGDRAALLRCRDRMRASGDGDAFGLRQFALEVADVHLGERDFSGAAEIIPAGDATGISARRIAFALQLRCEAAAHAGLYEQALEMLEVIDRHGFLDLLWMDRCPLLAPLRDEPRFGGVRGRVEDRAHAVYDAMWAA